ncbi:MAG: hypothetical protein M3290_09855 [Actinomycetota bacterium]|nr:hypothetical protein [Actinomycetota bacterium]
MATFVVVPAIVLSGLASARTKHHTYALEDCYSTRFKPSMITIKLRCWADSGIYADIDKWASWDRKTRRGLAARAIGTIRLNDCNPNCAAGHQHWRKATIVLFDRGWCKKAHRHVYRRQFIKYRGRDHGPGKVDWPKGRFWLGCPHR